MLWRDIVPSLARLGNNLIYYGFIWRQYRSGMFAELGYSRGEGVRLKHFEIHTLHGNERMHLHMGGDV